MGTIQEQWAIALQHLQARRLVQAEQSFRMILKQAPNNAQVMLSLAQVCYEQKRTQESIEILREARDLQPDNINIRFSLAAVLAQTGRWQESIEQYQAVLRLSPDHETTLVNLGVAYYFNFEFGAAIECYEKALQANRENVMALYNLGLAQMRIGRSTEADASFRKVLAIAPAYGEAQSCLLFNLYNLPGVTNQELFEAHANWGEQYKHSAATDNFKRLDECPARPIRVGYVSPDFRRHSVAYFITPILEGHDRRNVECFCYSNVSNPDSVTARIRELADHWLDISSLSDEQVGKAIRKDNIDILVDLSGHTAGNRLKVFAQKPAPIQVTWVGYPGTTGLPAMDYRITDHRADPEGTSDKYHTEKLVRMEPCFLCYQPPTEAPEIGPLPAIKNGYITFGSFNNLSKLTKETILSWSILLRGIPDARLLIKAQARGSEAGYNDLSSAFLANGIERSRIEFIGYIPETQDHLDLYNKVDIALDTSPYNGTTTTCEALWMGVPVITLSGSRHASRVGVSLLHAAGLSEFVAESPEQYISIATQTAQNIDRLKDLRSSLRQTIRASSLVNKHEIIQDIESSYLKMMQAIAATPATRSD